MSANVNTIIVIVTVLRKIQIKKKTYMYLGASTRKASQQDVLTAEPPDVNTE